MDGAYFFSVSHTILICPSHLVPRCLFAVLGVEVCEPCLQLGPEVPYEPLHGPRGAVGQGADRVALDLLRQLPQEVDLLGAGVALN